jgi:hypothetical protein
MKGKSQRQLPCLELLETVMLTEEPGTPPADSHERPSTLAIETLGAMAPLAVINVLGMTVTLTAAIVDVTRVDSRSTSKTSRTETRDAGAIPTTMVTVLRQTGTMEGLLPALRTTDLVLEMARCRGLLILDLTIGIPDTT